MKNKNIERPKIEVSTLKPKLTAGQTQEIDVVFRITPPEAKAEEKKRRRLNLNFVLDRSGSMGGKKMQEARECAKYGVEQMLPTDKLGIVIFDQDVDVLMPQAPVENKEAWLAEINNIQPRGATALHEAWMKGCDQVFSCKDDSAINRTILITDGQANAGETRIDRIVMQTREQLSRNVSTSTIGIGRDFNEELLVSMAEAGGGNAWHVREPEEMREIFEVELNGLLTQFAENVKLALNVKNGVRLIDVLNDFDRCRDGRIRLPNLNAGSPLEIVLRMEVPETAAGERLELAEFELSYVHQDTNEADTIVETLEMEFDTAEVVNQLPVNKSAAQAVRLMKNARARKRTKEYIDQHDLVGAKQTIAEAIDLTCVQYAADPSPTLLDEIEDLRKLERLTDEDEIMAAKEAFFRQHLMKKGM